MTSISRLIGVLVSGCLIASTALILPSFSQEQQLSKLEKQIHSIEKDMKGGRVGVALHDTQTNREWSYRGDERFPLNSSFKSFACANLLSRVDDGVTDLGSEVLIRKKDLISWSPITEKQIGGTMSLGNLCEAAITMSDNTAANSVLDAIGGPAALTDFMRSIGDTVTRLDRREPELNMGTPGDPRDTTTPIAATSSIEVLLNGSMLSPRSRELLEDWMVHDKVANNLIRKVLPKGWRIADKTGAGGHGSRGIVAMVTPPQKKPIFMAIYLRETSLSLEQRNAVIARIADLIFKSL